MICSGAGPPERQNEIFGRAIWVPPASLMVARRLCPFTASSLLEMNAAASAPGLQEQPPGCRFPYGCFLLDFQDSCFLMP